LLDKYDIILVLRNGVFFYAFRLFIESSFFVYVSVMGSSKPKSILIAERLRKP